MKIISAYLRLPNIISFRDLIEPFRVLAFRGSFHRKLLIFMWPSLQDAYLDVVAAVLSFSTGEAPAW